MPKRGELWLVDFGIAQKIRPALIISIPYADSDRALIGVIPHTTALRGSRFEVAIPHKQLSQKGAFLVQGILTIPPKYFLRRLGVLTNDQLQLIEKSLLTFLGITQTF